MAWSPEQLQAIEMRGTNLLVAAAAGSGKTSVLVERIIRRVTDPQDTVDIDKLLVVTFTNAAAAEMRTRIGVALTEALRKQPANRQLERQSALLTASSISTIHAFCQNLIRQYFYRVDLDARFRIANETEIELLKADLLEKVFETFYLTEDEEFLLAVDVYGGESGDQPLQELVLELYEFSRSNPWPEAWLDDIVSRFEIAPDTVLEDTPWWPLLQEKTGFELEEGIRKLDTLIGQASQAEGLNAYAMTFTLDRLVLEDVLKASRRSWNAFAAAVADASFEKLGKTGLADPELKEKMQKERNKVKEIIKKIKEMYFQQPAANWLADLRKMAPVIRGLIKLIRAFGQAFEAAKRGKSILDFNDLEHYSLRILLDAEKSRPGYPVPSEVALALRERYAEVMVDEYQDINSVQEAILQMVASESRPNRFMVGDVKQSIYRFRLAEPSLFMAKYNGYRENPAAGGQRIDLTQNFRSRSAILQAANFLFCQLMTVRAGELEYGPAEKLYPGPPYPETDCRLAAGPAELHLIDKTEETDLAEDAAAEVADSENGASMTGFELEAVLIARRIAELKESNCHVYDKQTKEYRPLAWRDVVILLRSMKGKADILLEKLRAGDIPCYAELASGYFQETEVRTMVSLLGIIDNPRQDIPLAGVLRSPFGGFDAAELAEIRLLRQGAELWDAVQAAAAAADSPLGLKVNAFLAKFKGWQKEASRSGVADLVWGICRDTGYYNYVGGMPGGAIRQANLRALYDRARQYEQTNYRGLFRFLRFIERLAEKGADLAVARALGENEDVVRIMSIHKSKGLEFPVVIVADLGKGINLQDSKAAVVCHKNLGVGPYCADSVLRYRYPTLARLAIQHKLNMEAKAEEMRILYVALTRAREKLILTGTLSKLDKKCADWCGEVGRKAAPLPDSLLTAARTYLDWIGPALARHSDGQPLREYGCCRLEPMLSCDDQEAQWLIRMHKREALAENPQRQRDHDPVMEQVAALAPVNQGTGSEWVDSVLGWQYPFQKVVGKPAKLTVTEIKRRLEAQQASGGERWYQERALSSRPAFLQKTGRLTAAEIGTAAHAVMQHLDYHNALDLSSLKKQIDSMAARELITREQAAAVDTKAILAFLYSPLGQRLQSAVWVERELAFSVSLPVSRFYPETAGAEETIFVQGVADCLFMTTEGLVLVDYKTDRGIGEAQLIEKYSVQLTVYAEAIEMILHQRVREKYLYAFENKQIVRIDALKTERFEKNIT